MAKLGNVEFTAITDETFNADNRVPDKPIESGADICDHLEQEPITVNFSFTVTGDNSDQILADLLAMRDSKKIYDYVGVLTSKVYKNMVITNLNIPKNSSVCNGFYGTISLKQIKIVSFAQTTVKLVSKDPVTNKKPQNTKKTETKKKTPEKKALENISENSLLKMLIGG